MDTQQELIHQLQTRTAKVAILGLGYVGLPLAVVFAEAGFEVIGIDPIAEKVEMLNRGESYIIDVPTETVKRLVRLGKLSATT
ncbi:MAG TPA: 3-hydroxyacyl-CoA dehydrogenase NAD-binding domain-containing protein, partial [Anaerolineaceae bacterium]|nr:3-hydroxyacyl-CoA dehydrogenase NAD-binding domain-containing protein [Anaerolineaceae bacterium]